MGVAMAVLACGLAIQAPVAKAAEPLVVGLQQWLDGTKTLQGSFEQSLLSGALGAGLQERGKIWLERPGHMRWDYSEPDPKIAIVVGQETLLYLPEDRQLLRGRLGDAQSTLTDLLTSGGRIAELFEASAVDRAAGDARTTRRLRLVPRRGSGSVEEVVLLLDERRFEILGADVLDAAGNRVAYRFPSWRRNQPISPGLFAFEPPPGTEIIDQE